MASHVGASEDRTEYKHLLLDAELGRLSGVLRFAKKGTIPVSRDIHVIDLCAGDGAGSVFSERSSPQIIAKHFDHPRGLSQNVRKRATLYEKADNTFRMLSDRYGHRPDFSLVNDDAAGFRVIPSEPRQAIFVYADPNSLSQLPINTDMIESFTPYTTFMATLGCNVGGLKRTDREKREQYFSIVNKLASDVPASHDCLLIWLNRDASQWAYLIRVPVAWSAETSARCKKAGDKVFKNGVSVASLRYSTPIAWDAALQSLLFTKKERGDV